MRERFIFIYIFYFHAGFVNQLFYKRHNAVIDIKNQKTEKSRKRYVGKKMHAKHYTGNGRYCHEQYTYYQYRILIVRLFLVL